MLTLNIINIKFFKREEYHINVSNYYFRVAFFVLDLAGGMEHKLTMLM